MKRIKIEKWNDLNTDCRIFMGELVDILNEYHKEEENAFIFDYVYESISEAYNLDELDKWELNSYRGSVEFFNIVNNKDFN